MDIRDTMENVTDVVSALMELTYGVPYKIDLNYK